MKPINTTSQHEWHAARSYEPQDKVEDAPLKNDACLEKVLAQTQQREKDLTIKPIRYAYNIIGQIIKYQAYNQALVRFSIDHQHYQYEAATTVELNYKHQDQTCVLSFNQGYLDQPIIVGIIQSEVSRQAKISEPLVLKSEHSVSLQCGASRIELDENGTINIQGMHINSQAYGPYRIKGGSVKIN